THPQRVGRARLGQGQDGKQEDQEAPGAQSPPPSTNVAKEVIEGLLGDDPSHERRSFRQGTSQFGTKQIAATLCPPTLGVNIILPLLGQRASRTLQPQRRYRTTGALARSPFTRERTGRIICFVAAGSARSSRFISEPRR